MDYTRRSFVKTAGIGSAAFISSPTFRLPTGAIPDVEILNPYNRVPISLIIDDSTCLVNMAHFGIPQFAEVFPLVATFNSQWCQKGREVIFDLSFER